MGAREPWEVEEDVDEAFHESLDMDHVLEHKNRRESLGR